MNPLDGWLAVARGAFPAGTLGPEDEERLGAIVDELARMMHITLDVPTLRAMAFTLAAVQAVHVTLSPTSQRPDEPGYAESVEGAAGLIIHVVARRLDELLTIERENP
jgi:hypothetical protein